MHILTQTEEKKEAESSGKDDQPTRKNRSRASTIYTITTFEIIITAPEEGIG